MVLPACAATLKVPPLPPSLSRVCTTQPAGAGSGRRSLVLWDALTHPLKQCCSLFCMRQDNAVGGGSLSNTAAQALSAGLLSASALHLWVLLPILAGGWSACCSVGFTSEAIGSLNSCAPPLLRQVARWAASCCRR